LKYTRKQTEELVEKYSKPIDYKNNIPVFKAIKKNPYQMKMFCPFCKIWHSHGYETKLGHRSAHCGNFNSPFFHTGYYIVLVDGEEK
jgi:hypothetical protein